MPNKYPKATPPGPDTAINTSSCFRMTHLHKKLPTVIQNIAALFTHQNSYQVSHMLSWQTNAENAPQPCPILSHFFLLPSLNPSLWETQQAANAVYVPGWKSISKVLDLCNAIERYWKRWMACETQRGSLGGARVVFSWDWSWIRFMEGSCWGFDRQAGWDPALLRNRSGSEPLLPAEECVSLHT